MQLLDIFVCNVANKPSFQYSTKNILEIGIYLIKATTGGQTNLEIGILTPSGGLNGKKLNGWGG